ncbi:MAG: NAD(P)(+) transhydrogenase (Re/Si-specific) subunit beta [Phycisphaerales bacterium]|nr:NAD(P)(+) transhydrogenase (Re/Si-specific) subunit beta [Phycisphaerales bacterium]
MLHNIFTIAQDAGAALTEAAASATAEAAEPAVTSAPIIDWATDSYLIAYLIAAVLFVVGLKKLSSPKTARNGNRIAAVGMLIAVIAALSENPIGINWWAWVFGGIVIGAVIGWVAALKVKMTAMPEMVALFNGFGGIASVLVASSEYIRGSAQGSIPSDTAFTIGIAILIGGITFTGSFIAWAKLAGKMSGAPILYGFQRSINAVLLLVCVIGSGWLAVQYDAAWWVWIILVISFVLGVTFTIPVGGADMPVVIALLNSYSGLAASATGFVLKNPGLIISGALVGASGLILTAIMCKAMNRSLANVLFAGVGTADSTGSAGTQGASDKVVRSVDVEDVAIMLDAAKQVAFVPGYGLAVAQGQHAVRDLTKYLESKDVTCFYGIHPVAGRMPGHMNVLLAEADVPYDELFDLDQANAELPRTDVVIVLGANDVVNPAARHDTTSPIYGMPILDVDKSTTVIVCKRSMSAGYSGVDNELFYHDNTLMCFGDAKKSLQGMLTALKEL